MFQGRTALSLDAKGRLAIPARHREALVAASGGQIVLTAHPQEDCLLLYPAPAWEPVRDKIMAASSFDKQVAAYQRRLVGYACDSALDSAGRLLIPWELRQLAKFEKQVWFIGQGSRFEIWSDIGYWQQQNIFDDIRDQPLPSELKGLTL
ncbi:MAG: division/cell wall cluster transcriptional repressor MraZ [Candidatus Accumulibacter sp.]|jgi:MraZ protein|nr:division/cell wall cluster transcriptional repressor MraZ [Accumulibacter sp.]